MKRLGVFNRGLRRLPLLGQFLDGQIVPVFLTPPPDLDATLGWGRSPYAQRARREAIARGIPFLCLEDGFLRSVGLGSDEPPLSIVVDDLGIYYDAHAPSRLETLITAPLGDAQNARAQGLIQRWRATRLSKYNHARELRSCRSTTVPVQQASALSAVIASVQDICRDKPYVLAVDQTFGDASVRCGWGSASSFDRMLDAALTENPDCRVLLKVHPEVMAGRKKGYFDLATLTPRNPHLHILSQDVHPVSLIEHAQAVYVVTSQLGFEALLWGKRVRVFGMPFYAGWGLTEDDIGAPLRRRPVPLENVVHGALIDYPRYVDPETQTRCEIERLVEWMGLQRQMRERFPADVLALGFSRWKQPIVRDFFQGSSVRFVETTKTLTRADLLAVWGRKQPLASVRRQVGEDQPVVHLEDGFLRSVGLGADLVRPLSWVMDLSGIYYDATQSSDLETLLQNGDFKAELLARARALRQRLVATGVTKYNVGTAGQPLPIGRGILAAQRTRRLDSASDQHTGIVDHTPKSLRKTVILVPGQVESDASLAYGAPGIRRNLELLRAVRTAHPEAHVIYKPHPDVVAGLRLRGHGEEDVAPWCDELLTDIAMGDLLPKVDEVHTLTSLTGFEALLRGKKVVCYGQPFYAGWGLTVDVLPLLRRRRKLTLDELVAGVLIVYPTYVSRTTGRFTSPERALDELLAWRQERLILRPIWQRLIGRLFRKD